MARLPSRSIMKPIAQYAKRSQSGSRFATSSLVRLRTKDTRVLQVRTTPALRRLRTIGIIRFIRLGSRRKLLLTLIGEEPSSRIEHGEDISPRQNLHIWGKVARPVFI